MSSPDLHVLDAPPDVVENGGHEVVRAFVSNGAVSVAMRRSFDDPFVWGMLLVDLARHAARIYATEAEMSEGQAMARIVEGLQAELDNPTDTGATNAIN
ncbi:MAG: DUF5076 domain-containing protein [Alsobacter sp.]